MKTRKTKHISRRLRRFPRASEAVSALEYAILVGVVAVAIAGALVAFSDQIEDTINHYTNQVKNELPTT